ncbi:unnamed protein product, partial [Ectocarpus sp. 12 AP-2014]
MLGLARARVEAAGRRGPEDANAWTASRRGGGGGRAEGCRSVAARVQCYRSEEVGLGGAENEQARGE